MVCLEENIQCHFEKEGLLWKHSLINPGRLLLLFSFLSHMSVLHLQMLGPALDSGSGEESEQNPSWYRPYVLGRGDRKWSTTPLIKRCNGRDAVSNGEITRQTPPDSETSLWAAESLILTLPRSQMVWNMMNYPVSWLLLASMVTFRLRGTQAFLDGLYSPQGSPLSSSQFTFALLEPSQFRWPR